MATDWEHLQRYAQERDETAFAHLVREHVRFVHATARRILGSQEHDAQDVTQAVFLLLSRKAARIPQRGSLVGWLFLATRCCCAEVKRAQGRRRRHEREAAMHRPEAYVAPEEIRPLLDDALARLAEKERQTILLRYLEGKTAAETGAALGVSAEAVEKRLERGIEKLRAIFARKGVAVPAATLTAAMGAESAMAAPAGLEASAVGMSGDASAAAGSIAKGAAIMMKLAMLKVAAVIVSLVAIPVVAGIALNAAQADQPSAAMAATAVPPKLPFTLARDTTVITEPLNADGTPDYIKALNDKYSKGVTPENNAFVAWLGVMGTGDHISGWKADALLRDNRFLAMGGAKPSEGLGWTTYPEFLNEHGVPEEDAPREASYDEFATRRKLWRAEDFPLLADWLRAEGAVLDGAKAAFGRQRYWHPHIALDERTMATVEGPLVERNLTTTQDVQFVVAGCLCERSTLRANARDFDGFLSDVLAAKRISRRLATDGIPFERIRGILIDITADESIGAVAGAGILSAEQCAALAKALDSIGPNGSLSETIDVAQRWTLLDDAFVVASGKAKLLAVIPEPFVDSMHPGSPEQLVRLRPRFPGVEDIEPGAVNWDVVLKRLNRGMDDELAAIKKPLLEDVDAAWAVVEEEQQAAREQTEGRLAKETNETREAYTERIGEAFWGYSRSRPDMHQAARQEREAVMQAEMVRAVAAAAEYQAKTGNWPAKLEELVPAYLKEVPKDIYVLGGKATVRYTVGVNGIRAYSIGRNRADDGGVNHPEAEQDDIVVGVPAE